MGDLIDRDALLIEMWVSLNEYHELGKIDMALAYGSAMSDVEHAETVDVRPQWISIKDRLPCEYGNYLAIVSGEVMECLYSGCNTGFNNAWSTCDAYGFKYIPETEITHWMPLPKAPEEDT